MRCSGIFTEGEAAKLINLLDLTGSHSLPCCESALNLYIYAIYLTWDEIVKKSGTTAGLTGLWVKRRYTALILRQKRRN